METSLTLREGEPMVAAWLNQYVICNQAWLNNDNCFKRLQVQVQRKK